MGAYAAPPSFTTHPWPLVSEGETAGRLRPQAGPAQLRWYGATTTSTRWNSLTSE